MDFHKAWTHGWQLNVTIASEWRSSRYSLPLLILIENYMTCSVGLIVHGNCELGLLFDRPLWWKCRIEPIRNRKCCKKLFFIQFVFWSPGGCHSGEDGWLRECWDCRISVQWGGWVIPLPGAESASSGGASLHWDDCRHKSPCRAAAGEAGHDEDDSDIVVFLKSMLLPI